MIRSEDDTKKSREAARAAAELDAARSTTTTTKDAIPADRATTTPLAVAAATAAAVAVTSTLNEPSTDRRVQSASAPSPSAAAIEEVAGSKNTVETIHSDRTTSTISGAAANDIDIELIPNPIVDGCSAQYKSKPGHGKCRCDAVCGRLKTLMDCNINAMS